MRKKMHQRKVTNTRLKLVLHLLSVRHYQAIVIRKSKQFAFLQLLLVEMLKEDIWWWNITNCGLKPCGTIVKEMWKKKFRMTVEGSHYLLCLLVGRKLQKVDTFLKKKKAIKWRSVLLLSFGDFPPEINIAVLASKSLG